MPLYLRILLLGITLTCSLYAQNLNYPISFQMGLAQDGFLQNQEELYHSSFKPLNRHFTPEAAETPYTDSMKVYFNFHLKLYKRHFVEIEGEDYSIYIDPLFNFEMGVDLSDTSGRGTLQDEGGLFHTNTRGIQVQGDIGKNFSFYTSFYENQSYFPDYLRLYNWSMGEFVLKQNGYAHVNSIVPGQGRAKAFKTTGFDYAWATGYISWALNKNIQLQFGNGRHMIGNGYRSVILSDAAFNYPYWQVRTSALNDHLRYNFTYAYLTNLYRLPEHTAPEATFVRKNGTFHHITYTPIPAVEIGLFEGTMWKVYDSINGTQPVDLISHAPVPFLSSAINGLSDSSNNVVLGFNARVNLPKNFQLYGQVAIDDISTGRMGYQAGIKAYEPFDISRLTVLFEYNTISAYTYSHINSWQNYVHYNQSLAHPYGAGFHEFVGYVHYLFPKRWWLSYKLNVADLIGTYRRTDNGNNLFTVYTNSKEPNGDRSHLSFQEYRIGYRCNVKTNMDVFLGLNRRRYSADGEVNMTNYVHLGFKTGIFNRYYDL